MATVIAVRDVRDCWNDAQALMADNWGETGMPFSFAPSLETYAKMQDAGYWFALSAYDGADLVGYSSVMLAPTPLNPSFTLASTEALYVARHRRGVLGARLVRETEREAARRGAQWLFWHTRAGTGFAGMLERRAYTPIDVVLGRRLNDGD